MELQPHEQAWHATALSLRQGGANDGLIYQRLAQAGASGSDAERIVKALPGSSSADPNERVVDREAVQSGTTLMLTGAGLAGFGLVLVFTGLILDASFALYGAAMGMMVGGAFQFLRGLVRRASAAS